MTPEAKENRAMQTIWGARYAAAIVGNVRTGDYELVDIDKLPLSEEATQNFMKRGFERLGVIALHEDGPRVAVEYDGFDVETIRTLSVRFLKQLERELNARVAKRVGDSLEWVNRLHKLPDLRNEMEN